MKRKTWAKQSEDRDQAKENKYQRRTLPKADLRQIDGRIFNMGTENSKNLKKKKPEKIRQHVVLFHENGV